MKIARVYTTDYPSHGRLKGDIHDVFDADNHPGSLLGGVLKEIEVADDFDKATMSAEFHTEKWTKEGQADVYVDPSDETYAHVEGEFITFSEDSVKVTAKEDADKQAQIEVKYNEMTADVLGEMADLFGTTRTDSAAANERTWEIMTRKPELFSGRGLVATKDAGGYTVGEALDTNAKIQAWAEAMIALVEAYGVSRVMRMKQFADEKAAILAGS